MFPYSIKLWHGLQDVKRAYVIILMRAYTHWSWDTPTASQHSIIDGVKLTKFFFFSWLDSNSGHGMWSPTLDQWSQPATPTLMSWHWSFEMLTMKPFDVCINPYGPDVAIQRQLTRWWLAQLVEHWTVHSMTRVLIPSGAQENFMGFTGSKMLCRLTVSVPNPCVYTYA